MAFDMGDCSRRGSPEDKPDGLFKLRFFSAVNFDVAWAQYKNETDPYWLLNHQRFIGKTLVKAFNPLRDPIPNGCAMVLIEDPLSQGPLGLYLFGKLLEWHNVHDKIMAAAKPHGIGREPVLSVMGSYAYIDDQNLAPLWPQTLGVFAPNPAGGRSVEEINSDAMNAIPEVLAPR